MTEPSELSGTQSIRVGSPRTSLLALLVLPIFLATSACVSNRMYRPDNIQQESDYTLAFIELDDQGELWSAAQVSRTVELIERANRTKDGSVVILFIHGWNNNASPKQEQKKKKSLYGFKQFLTHAIRDAKGGQPGRSPKVIGVFVAWRGKSAHQPFESLTFYGRRRAASRLSSGPTVTEVLTRVVEATKQNPKSKIILIGHSFGGLIMERALAQVMVGDIVQERDEEIDLPVDLVVLINPASPSINAKQLVDVLARQRARVYRVDAAGKHYERPLLVSVTSRADWATRFAYPIGSSLGAFATRFRKYGAEQCSPTASQRGFYLYTPGHRSALHSHVVTAERLPEGGQRIEGLRYEDDPETGERAVSFDGHKHRFTIKKKPRALNDTPYWIMSVPGSLIASHSDIFRVDTTRLIRALLHHTGALVPDSATVLLQETGIRPIGLAIRPSGELIFVDRSRRIYAVPTSLSNPIFVGCLPEVVDPGAVIGGFDHEDAVVLISNRTIEHKDGDVEYRTETVRISLPMGGKARARRFAGSKRFTVATGDPVGQKAYLATKDEIYVADLSQARPKPEPLARIDGAVHLGRVRFDASRRRLFALDSQRGHLYLVDLKLDAPRARLVTEGLGQPNDLRVYPATGEVYIADVKGKRIWRLTCDSDQCSKKVFVQSDAFVAPAGVAVAPDGTVWVADIAAHKLFAIGPYGTFHRTISSLAGTQE